MLNFDRTVSGPDFNLTSEKELFCLYYSENTHVCHKACSTYIKLRMKNVHTWHICYPNAKGRRVTLFRLDTNEMLLVNPLSAV